MKKELSIPPPVQQIASGKGSTPLVHSDKKKKEDRVPHKNTTDFKRGNGVGIFNQLSASLNKKQDHINNGVVQF